jgi:hypothetical protein
MNRQLAGRLGIAVIAIAAVTAGISILGDNGSPPPSPSVVYDSNGLGLVHQELDVALPWRKVLSWPSAGSIQLLGQGSGAVECRVSVGSRVVKTQQPAPGEVAACVS